MEFNRDALRNGTKQKYLKGIKYNRQLETASVIRIIGDVISINMNLCGILSRRYCYEMR